MSIDIKVYDNGDHTAIVWLPSDAQPISGCRGFAIKRRHNGNEDFLRSFVGFSDTDKFDAQNPWKWPLQRYMWWDYGLKLGDTVSYQVIPMLGTAADLKQDTELASTWTDEMKVSGQCTPHLFAYFNKGLVAAQWVSRALDAEAQGVNREAALQKVIAQVHDPLRDALAGLLKTEILTLLDKAQGGQLFAALYELRDPELIAALKKLGKSAHLILANGAFNSKAPDENAAVREELKGVIDVTDRLVTSGHFAHNKFAVICDSAGKAERVLTGSTNWTPTGLCTQANNALVIDDGPVANCFLEEWGRLKAAGNGFPPALITENSKQQQFEVDGVQITPWFAPTSDQQDLNYVRKLITGAKEGLLFLFFNPGVFQEDPQRETLLQNILERHNPSASDFDPGLYIRGVVNQEIANLTDGTPPKTTGAPVQLFTGGKQDPQRLTKDVLVPANVKQKFHNWEDEALRAGLVMVHSKVIVIDPFGAHPVLVTGSHNLGVKASEKNDDNLVVLEGPDAAPLAAAYAANIIAIFQAYRWNSYVVQHQQDPHVWHGLQDDDKWQAGHLKGDSLHELHFWMGSAASAPAPAHAAAATTHAGASAAKRAQTHRVKFATNKKA